MTPEQLKYVNDIIDLLPKKSPEVLLEELVPSETLPKIDHRAIIDKMVTNVSENASDEECSKIYKDWIRICHRKYKSNSIKRKRDEERIKKGLIPYHLILSQRIGKNKKRCEPHWKIKACLAYKKRQERLRKQRELKKEKKKQLSV